MAVTGLVPAAGESSRTKGFKLFYDWNGQSILQTVIKNMSPYCNSIIVVSGYKNDEIADHLKEYAEVRIVNNPDWKKGMISSITKGLEQAGGRDILYCPADYPGISPETFRFVKETGMSASRICMAEFHGKTGPPLYISGEETDKFLKSRWKGSFRGWVNKRSPVFAECADSWVLKDIDDDDTYKLVKP